MLAEPYQTVFNKIRDTLTNDFAGLPEVPMALMVGNSKLHQMIELNLYASGQEQHDANFFETYTKLTAYQMQADFALTYTEGWIIKHMMIEVEGITLDEMREAAILSGGIEKHPDAQEVLLVSLECLDGQTHTEICPIQDGNRLTAWEAIPVRNAQGVLSSVLEICRDPETFPTYQAFMERLQSQPPAAELH